MWGMGMLLNVRHLHWVIYKIWLVDPGFHL